MELTKKLELLENQARCDGNAQSALQMARDIILCNLGIRVANRMLLGTEINRLYTEVVNDINTYKGGLK